jgi:hypothetical protein
MRKCGVFGIMWQVIRITHPRLKLVCLPKIEKSSRQLNISWYFIAYFVILVTVFQSPSNDLKASMAVIALSGHRQTAA